jgi:hypothetical protein
VNPFDVRGSIKSSYGDALLNLNNLKLRKDGFSSLNNKVNDSKLRNRTTFTKKQDANGRRRDAARKTVKIAEKQSEDEDSQQSDTKDDYSDGDIFQNEKVSPNYQ